MIDDKSDNLRTKERNITDIVPTDTIASGLVASRGIAVDWIAKNIYWIDAGAATITVSTIDGSVQRTFNQ